jgi:transposase
MKIKKDVKKMILDRKIVQEIIAGKSNRQISREFKICQKKVAKFKKLAQEEGYLDKNAELPAYPAHPFPKILEKNLKFSENEDLLLPHLDWMKERLNAGWHKVSLFEESPVRIPRASFYRFLKRHKLLALQERKNDRVIPEIFHEPGEAFLLDWGLLRTVVDPKTKKKRKLWAFVGVLGYSRYMTVRLVWTCDTKTTIHALEDMFQELGGITKRVTTDNPKCFALEASDYEPIFNPIFERFADHFGFTIECLPPRDPQKKENASYYTSFNI